MIASSSKISASGEGTRKRGRGKRVEVQAPDQAPAPVADEESTVEAFRTALLDRNLLPHRHDDYHTMKRSVLIGDRFPSLPD